VQGLHLSQQTLKTLEKRAWASSMTSVVAGWPGPPAPHTAAITRRSATSSSSPVLLSRTCARATQAVRRQRRVSKRVSKRPGAHRLAASGMDCRGP